ncbi:U4/U6 x U5 tri-snRNP complex subunit Prp1 [Dispira parvispora]|uniref:U4/U6 x U5 tri-snRNP complex subunit Prp1 n=1 Tax=Dispira parvispora TaxID=1520584 RepID=A0A9W8E9G7_9FUNG|nr:U4/U6 x U5 tri-snRNP complex subunit Prp1 [Dispira parvispora]
MFPVTKDFLGKPAPPNYVAGLGRGATGFTTRSDIGPAREAAPQGPGSRPPESGEAGQDTSHQDPDNETGLFSSLPYEQDDEEADRIYAEVDARMEERRKRRREAQEDVELERSRSQKSRIRDQFSDLKLGLSTVTEEEWANLPEAGNLVGKPRKGRLRDLASGGDPSQMRYSPVPDTALLRNQQLGTMAASIDPYADNGATSTLTDTNSQRMDLVELGQARKQMLGVHLDKFSDAASGSSTVDPRGYLTDLNSLVIQSDAEIADIKRARTLLQAVTTTNPKHAPGWIAAARLEEVAGKLRRARVLIAKGCEECPTNEDIWLEAARLNPDSEAKALLSRAVRHLPQSIKIWQQAMRLESEPKMKRRVIRKALEMVPESVKLWKLAVSLEENPSNARILLSRAVELVPLSVELWLALARLESYDNARKVLNRARKSVPTSHEVWLAGAKLEEQQPGHEDMVTTVVERAVNYFSIKNSILGREDWLKEAERCEQDGFPKVCCSIVGATLTLDLDPEDRETAWTDDAEQATQRGAIETARAIYTGAVQCLPDHHDLWLQAAYFEKQHGTRESLDSLLQRAVKYCPQEEILWLMGAKEQWLAGNVDAARDILGLAFDANPNSEQIWLAAIKLEMENELYDNARLLLSKARVQANTAKIWMKSVQLERLTNHPDEALTLLSKALALFPKFAKLWMIQGQLYEERRDLPAARQSYRQGTTHCPGSVPLWLLAARLETTANIPVRARALLERGRLLNPQSELLWLESIRLEVQQSGPTSPATKLAVSKALQDCPTSGLLWAEAIFLEPRAQRKARSVDAMKKCPEDSMVFVAIARLFWNEGKFDKARVWFDRASKLDPDLGDTWAWWYRFECQHGTAAQQEHVLQACVRADPHHGERWQPIAKDLKMVRKPIGDKLKLVAESLDTVT